MSAGRWIVCNSVTSGILENKGSSPAFGVTSGKTTGVGGGISEEDPGGATAGSGVGAAMEACQTTVHVHDLLQMEKMGKMHGEW